MMSLSQDRGWKVTDRRLHDCDESTECQGKPISVASWRSRGRTMLMLLRELKILCIIRPSTGRLRQLKRCFSPTGMSGSVLGAANPYSWNRCPLSFAHSNGYRREKV